MRRLSLLTPLLACAACIINPPVVLPVDTMASVDETYDCAVRSLNEMQYTISAADRGSGFVRARRLRKHLFGTDSDYDQQTVRACTGRTMGTRCSGWFRQRRVITKTRDRRGTD
jgi:hypothetical protein